MKIFSQKNKTKKINVNKKFEIKFSYFPISYLSFSKRHADLKTAKPQPKFTGSYKTK